MSLSDLRLSASSHQLSGGVGGPAHAHQLSKSTSVTPTGSLLCVHNTIQLRESTLTVNYPDTGIGEYALYFFPLCQRKEPKTNKTTGQSVVQVNGLLNMDPKAFETENVVFLGGGFEVLSPVHLYCVKQKLG